MEISFKAKTLYKIKIFISKIVLFFLYRGFNIVNKIDQDVYTEVEKWRDGYTIKIQTSDNGPSLILKKQGKKIVRLKNEQECDLEIIFKNLDSAFLLLTGRLGIAKAYCEHRFLLKGDIMEAMSLVRCLDIVETYLFPKFISKHLVKKVKKTKSQIIVTYLRILFNY